MSYINIMSSCSALKYLKRDNGLPQELTILTDLPMSIITPTILIEFEIQGYLT